MSTENNSISEVEEILNWQYANFWQSKSYNKTRGVLYC